MEQMKRRICKLLRNSAGSVSAGTCTRVTPAIRKSRESHWYKPNLFPNMETENSAVVRIFSWGKAYSHRPYTLNSLFSLKTRRVQTRILSSSADTTAEEAR
ncbi:hypothetical protein EYF80_019952 [Liparis tanakae]|uniref:Uncharacterized protein n=1 Tax=Liparis tanakae TaxID=230148 RepID=A0A4Z2HXY9_9TELE|nr:hypothetical protein EYF80_019952 [Liparis tanakae]